MPRLLYVSLMRTPTEKAHGLQIVQNCEAFANNGYDVELWGARRWNTPKMRAVNDIHAYYGVQPTFNIRRIPVLDVMPLAGGIQALERIAFYLQIVTYIIIMWLLVWSRDDDIFYTRDEYVLLALSLIKPRHKLVYEAHLFPQTRGGAWVQRQTVRRAGTVVAITAPMKDALINQRGADAESVMVAHDGIRAARFADLPDRATARQQIGWQGAPFIVGFVGRLHMLNTGKGVDTLVEALSNMGDDVAFALVGGPDDMADSLRNQWLAAGHPPERFLYAGQVLPEQVPLYMRAFDVCVMPHPHTEQYAYYTSPLKLFEYMASGTPVIASDLPAWADVVQDGVTALLFPPGDVGALRTAIERLQADPALRDLLADAAEERVFTQYTWDMRAKHILEFAAKRKEALYARAASR